MNTVDLTNTPGYYYAIAYWMSAVRLIILFHGNEEQDTPGGAGKMNWPAYAGFLVFLTVFMEITKTPPVYLFLVFVAAEFTMLLLFIKRALKVTSQNAFFYTVQAFIMGEFLASLTWQIFYFVIRKGWISYGKPQEILFMLFFYFIMLQVIKLMDKHAFKRSHRIYTLEKEEVLVAAIILVFTYFFSNLSYVFQGTPFSTGYLKELFIIRTMADLMGLGIFTAYAYLLENTRGRMELEMLRKTLQMQYDNYKIAEESIDLVNRKYHDLKHQIGLLRREVPQEQAAAYLDKVEKEISAYEAQNKTGNHVLDTILTSKALLCQSNGIRLSCMADGALLNFMDPMDISSLFGNILDNAIEGAMTLEDEKQRLISLRVMKQKGFLTVMAENRFAGEIQFRDGNPVTTKPNPDYHGFGVRSIRVTAEKYAGTTKIDTREGWFRVSILFPPEAFEDENDE